VDPDGHPYLYYTCTHVAKDGSAAECPVRSIPTRAFEDLIIGYRESVVADKQVIADALLRFNSVMKSLPPGDQKELVQLLGREVSVKHSDPEKDPAPREKGVFNAKIRTKSSGPGSLPATPPPFPEKARQVHTA